MNYIKVALSNIKFFKFKYIIIFLLIFITSISIFTSDILLKSINEGLEKSQDRLGADAIIVPSGYEDSVENTLFNGTPCTLTFDKKWEEKIKQIDGVKQTSSQLYLATLPEESCCDGEIQLIAIDPKNDFLISPWLSENNISDLKNDEIILGSNFKIPIGDTVTYYNKKFTVAAIMNQTGMGYDKSAFISFDAANEIVKNNKTKFTFNNVNNTCSMIFVKAKDINADVMKEMIKSRFGTNEINVYTTDKKINDFKNEVNNFKILGSIMNVIIIILSTIALFAINTITIIQRKNEIGSMLTVGITKNKIIKIYLTENLLISFISIIISILFTTLLMYLFNTSIQNILNIPFVLPSIIKLLLISLKLIIINILIIIVALSNGFKWIYKKSPSEMIKEVI